MQRAQSILSPERLFVAGAAGCAGAFLGAALIARLLFPGAIDPALSCIQAALLCTIALALALSAERAALVTGTPLAAAVTAFALGWPSRVPPLLAMGLADALLFVASLTLLAPRLPAWLDGAWERRRTLSWLWALAVGVCLVQLAKAGAYLQDPSLAGARALPTAGPHSCLPAYLRGAELALSEAPNLYLAALYQRGVPNGIDGMAAHLGDPFQYPPPALLLPAALLTLSRDFLWLRGLWFVGNAALFGFAVLSVARRLESPSGARAALIAPILLCSLPVLTSLEYGQAQLLTLATAMLGMLALEQRRLGLGAGLLGLAICTKLFPALLLVHLLVRRRLAALAATLTACGLLSAAAWAWFGAAPFAAFASYQLPRLASGAAFDAFVSQPDFDTIHMGVPGLALLLDRLGVAALGGARALGSGYTVVLIALPWAIRRRHDDPVLWLALLNLAAARSLYAPAVYGVVGTLWLLAIGLARYWPHRGWVAMAGAAAGLLATAPFASHLPLVWSLPGVTWAASLACMGLSLAVNLFALSPQSSPPAADDETRPTRFNPSLSTGPTP